mmetsp:Transcript_5432/g.7342  ORF Transcript_5432/g.7342 Transcript_5432/m.7342 type:complete len:266 (+) Transcript_5432:116-913(+)|eukprot:CAMPEP_0196587478 /NCGR_PEP_ID=MMETSP1081-20130531/57592_1 /TAXON_ID=36882 /ORGANISM="Pyramimonas amylifera, Strain CCMP720" /LENGTH=265 /DNA_ID=CAMNT_0041909671 /DNA_START=79 /DNA_END=876 /DNA_ORIENTATION=-
MQAKANPLGNVKLSPADVVMKSIESGKMLTDRGEYEQALRILRSVDEICKREGAPPPVHGLALRVLSDALLLTGELEEARGCLITGIKMNELALQQPGLPQFLVQDVSSRLGDLCGALGELERQTKNWKESLRALRKSAGFFEGADLKQFQVATLNRVAFTLLEKKDYTDALGELREAITLADALAEDHAAACICLRATNFRHQAACHEGLGETDLAKELNAKALTEATQSGDAGLIAELNEKLNLGDEPETEVIATEGGGDGYL